MVLLKGLFHLPVMLEEADVIGHPVAALGNGGEAGEDPAVHLPGIGLAADGEDLVETELGGNLPVHPLDLLPIPVKEIQEAGLRAGGTPAA